MAAPIGDLTVLSYYDSLLRQSDLDLLDDGKWLNDKLISFAFEYFEHEIFNDFENDLAFLCADVTQFIKFGQKPELDVFLEPLQLQNRALVFIPVNDNSSTEEAGGTHWSLMVFRRKSSSFSHYDSYGQANSYVASEVAKKIFPYLKDPDKLVYCEEQGPQQTNSSDCGLFVIGTAEHICRQTFLNDATPLSTSVTAEKMSLKREELRQLIKTLASKQH